ncbi:MAG: hypothetical protein JNM60_05945 [Candidatus Competibacteraceae bacterium]|nr:hypothetical protein [Candidatus Competibacteraceae bacterium]
MDTDYRPADRWINWLLAASAGVSVFGLLLVLAPTLTRQGFSLMIYGATATIDGFGAEQVRYISLAHAVLGGVMVGWGCALFFAVKSFFARNPRATWNLFGGSVLAWFIPDTAYSPVAGYWPNAVLNAGFAVIFGVPLWATRGAKHSAG